MILEIPWEPVPLNSPFYIRHNHVEELIYEEIAKGGSLIRIKSPQKTGKTSLVLRLLAYAQSISYLTVNLDFQLAEESVFTSLDKLLLWFGANVTQQLHIPVMINEYYNEYVGAKVNCTVYFQEYLLKKVNTPIVLVLNELNRLFEYPHVAQDFLAMLRSWYEEAKHNDGFKQLRYVLVYSTEIYINLNINQSPFNVGLPVSLPEFTVEQIQHLAQVHNLNWEGKQGKSNAFELHASVGGHPYLVRLALYDLAIHPFQTLSNLLETAPTLKGIYSTYLRGLLAVVIKNPELAAALQQLINNRGSAKLNHIVAHKLESLGLVKLNELECSFSCNLYRKYFSSQNLEELNVWQFMKNLQQNNQYLGQLSNSDYITTLGNQRYFETSLNQVWSMVAEEEAPISIILLDVDHLKIYNKHFGWEAGNESLRKIANVIDDVTAYFCTVGTFSIRSARLGSGEFGILLPSRSDKTAFEIAETIRNQVFSLNILHDDTVIFGLAASVMTISSGIACSFINANLSPSMLMQATREALYQSKRNGRNTTSVSSTLNCGFLC
ncbi:diguanylate cyclase [Calothrix sp. NIES-4071]|nr:diguanylate cyclase [Calothrix sp. NIES-4071]BAZ56138.1 diguanylate cyclase [Calothrix sp. NIES-4105]